jgi:hypothetical protein
VAINKERPPLPADAPPRLAALICRCWAEDPGARPRVGQLLAELDDMMKVGQEQQRVCVPLCVERGGARV